MRKKVIFLTGASSGLGLVLAKQLLLSSDYFLVLSSRAASAFRFGDQSILEDESRVWLRELDIVDHRQIAKVITEIEEKLGGVDVLINNAGISERSTVEDSSDSTRQLQLDVNYLAPFELITHVLPSMRAKRSGQIINISSASGFMAMPTMSSYSASKFALEAASEALWYEMKPWGIKVTLVVPGFINSEGYLNTRDTLGCRNSTTNRESAYYEHYRGMKALIRQGMTHCWATNESVAHKIVKLIESKNAPLRINVTLEASLLFWMRKLLPPTAYHFVLYRLLPNIRRWGKDKVRRRISRPES